MASRHKHNRARVWTRLSVVVACLLAPHAVFAQNSDVPRLHFAEAPTPAETPKLGPAVILPPQEIAPAPRTNVRLLFEPVPPPEAPLFEYRHFEVPVPPAVPVSEEDAESTPASQVVQTSCVFSTPRPVSSAVVPVQGLTTENSQGAISQGPAGSGDGFSCLDGCLRCGVHPCRRLCGGLHECLCCPDPCYVPRWQPLADTAFDVAAARPITHQRLRWNAGVNLSLPDRAEFFWARADGKGRGPVPAPGALLASNRVNYNDLSYYFEAAIDRFALVVDVPFRVLDPAGVPQATGLGDVRFGTKSLLFDCELLQVGAQLLVYVPTGSDSRGLGTGHYSLEPSLLCGVFVGPNTYLQGQLSEWIPLGGDGDYRGAVLHSHVALNHLLCRANEDCLLMGTIGFNSWTFQAGAFTDPVLGSNQPASGFTYLTVGPGLRLFVCDRIDLGFAAQFALTRPHFAETLYTTEFRWRF